MYLHQLSTTQKTPPKPSKITATLAIIPSGRAGVVATLKLMRDFIRAGRKALPVRLLALDLVARLKQKDFHGEVSALYRFVKDRIRYVRDVRGVETLQTPDKTMQLKAGDCDDKSILLASLLEAIGHPTRLVAVGFRPGRFSHVFVQTRVGKKWVSLETTEPVELGWSPPNVRERLVMHV